MGSFRPVGPAALLVTAGVAAVAAVAADGLPAAVRYGPLLASVVLLGMPHGAVDHLLTVALVGRGDDTGADGAADATDGSRFRELLAGPWRRGLLAVAAVYAVGGIGYGLVWVAAPVAAAVGFLVLTWFHWGQGDLYHLLASAEQTHLAGRGVRALVLTVRGGLPMVVPLVAFPEIYRRVLVALAAVVSPAATVPDWPFAPGTRLAVGVGFAAVTVVALAAGWVEAEAAAQRRAWRVDAGETALLWAFFLVVPPILAVGSYFALWHSLRHVRRVVALPDAAATPGGVGRTTGGVAALDGPQLWAFARSAAPNTAGGLALFVAIYLAAPGGGGLLGVAAGYLVAIAVLTLPHAAVVTWLDLRQGVWTPGTGPG